MTQLIAPVMAAEVVEREVYLIEKQAEGTGGLALALIAMPRRSKLNPAVATALPLVGRAQVQQSMYLC